MGNERGRVGVAAAVVITAAVGVVTWYVFVRPGAAHVNCPRTWLSLFCASPSDHTEQATQTNQWHLDQMDTLAGAAPPASQPWTGFVVNEVKQIERFPDETPLIHTARAKKLHAAWTFAVADPPDWQKCFSELNQCD